MVNHGRVLENVSARQRYRKLSQFRSIAEAALWFAETFGLIVDKLVSHTVQSGEEIVISLGDSSPSTSMPPSPPPSSVPDEFCVMQILYLLDRFGVSDEFYHELTQVN